ncbi:SLBB domain-containing protein [candidate division KSB1 bacterium]|nr:SLBB domain-containing protein [candidate division KSB1 bacterium]
MRILGKKILVMYFIQFFTFSGLLVAQELKEDKYSRGAQYFLGTGDELLIKVNIWGFVNKPGQYMVPSETDLMSLISYAGGPSKGAKLSNIKIIHSESTSASEKNISEINVSQYLKDGDESLIPMLNPGDTIIISGSKWHHINSFVEFTTKLALLAQIYYLITFYSSK